jgi:hypothetical protein
VLTFCASEPLPPVAELLAGGVGDGGGLELDFGGAVCDATVGAGGVAFAFFVTTAFLGGVGGGAAAGFSTGAGFGAAGAAEIGASAAGPATSLTA